MRFPLRFCGITHNHQLSTSKKTNLSCARFIPTQVKTRAFFSNSKVKDEYTQYSLIPSEIVLNQVVACALSYMLSLVLMLWWSRLRGTAMLLVCSKGLCLELRVSPTLIRTFIFYIRTVLSVFGLSYQDKQINQ